MKMLCRSLCFVFLVVAIVPHTAHATGGFGNGCFKERRPAISFIEFQSYDIAQTPPTPLTVKGKLKLPRDLTRRQHCNAPQHEVPAVLILHGSAGIDARGDFYARALNAAGIATLEIDMWEARGVATPEQRPPLPIFTYADAFAALDFLSSQEGIDPLRIGVLGFSWGGVVSMAAAEELYAGQFGNGLRFAAHVAHYPVCYAFNNYDIPALSPPDLLGIQFLDLTGAPVLIQVGTEDDYDNGVAPCTELVGDLLDPADRAVVEVVGVEGAFHAWDRLEVPITVFDPFGDEGSVFATGVVPQVDIIPDVEQADASRRRVVRFFSRNL